MKLRQHTLAVLLCLVSVGAEAQKSKGGKKPPVPESQPQQQPTAPEADFTKAKALFERGESFYKLGEYEKALSEYRESYLVSKAPLLLVNIAQCYRYLGQYEEAKHNYEAYLREDPTSAYRADIEAKIAEMDAALEAERKKAAKTPTSLVVEVKPPVEQPRRVKPWMWGTVGAAVIGGSALTFVLLRGEEEPISDLGGQPVDF